MKRFEVPESDVPEFTRIHTQHVEGKASESSGKKKVEASKEFLDRWLKNHRDFDVGQMKVGDIVIIQMRGIDGELRDVFQIQKKNSGNRLDAKWLLSEQPDTHAKYSRNGAATYYDPIPLA